ncbi:MAG: TIGR03617 family F420-dependent LLM class oxidoreductase [Chloroflexi bacterium]|nr:TIGR03617 family F420-dependent LLM class oxidoreductase [Chloroflexota bacterium]MBI4314300.1 TIGR03617 family F420-dependent LLM class oxidoreductase [Chloroflexota bacterium]
MKLDIAISPFSLSEVPALARRIEALGADGLFTTETQHDPFLPLALAAGHTTRLELGTAVAIAFARSPMTVAHTAWDLAAHSGGRFLLGLGTQVKPHIERRFGMAWPESPVGQLREFIAAVRAVWQSWQTGERLNFRGERYKLTLMTPFFNPGPIEHPRIPIYIAGVNAPLIKLAGETADGFHVHPYHTRRYLAEVVAPNIEAGATKAGRARADVTLAGTAFVAVGDGEAARAPMREVMRSQIAFYASTPTYRPVMALHGWEAQAGQLSALAAKGQWGEMPAVLTDDMLAEFLVEGSWADIGGKLRARYDGLLDRVALYLPFSLHEDGARWAAVAGAIKA